METLTNEKLVHLARSGEPPVVTFLGPIRRPHERARAELEWKHLVADARQALAEASVPSATADRLVAPVEQMLLDEWPSHQQALACVSSPAGVDVFAVSGDVEPFWHVGDRPAFHVLCPYAHEAVGLVLALDLHHTALYELAGDRLEAIAIESLPSRIEDVLRTDERGQHLTHHGGAHVGLGIVGIMHGEDDAGREHEHELDHFCHAVDDALTHGLPSDDARPVVVAGVADLVARLRAIARRPERFAVEVDGSAARLAPTELAARARAALDKHRDDAALAAVATFRARDGLGLTSADVAEIAVAAADGRVDQLLLPRAAPGAQPTDVDGGAALDEVIAAVLGARGRVVVAPASALDTVAAIYRW